MEDNIQTVIVVIISTFLLFIFPVYMAYEKQDDISYALAMRYTQDFVNDVKSKGYITSDMYDNYKAQLDATGNTYDIELLHQYNRYDPITNYYKIEDGKYILVKTSTREEKDEYENKLKQEGITKGIITDGSTPQQIATYIDNAYKSQNIHKVEDTYELAVETYTTTHILNILNGERKLLLNSDSNIVTCSDNDESEDGCKYAYIMNVEDIFNVIIKNTNTTLATVIYNMVTAHTLDSNTRIYVNYGGKILASKWYGDIDYSKMKHDNLSLVARAEQVVFTDARHYFIKDGIANFHTANITTSDKEYSRYIIEFEAKPEDVTELREKGELSLNSYSGYNFALGTKDNGNNRLLVSVGLNGISILVADEGNSVIRKTFALPKRSQTIEDASGISRNVEVQTKINDYNKLYAAYDKSARQLSLNLTGSDGLSAYAEVIRVFNDETDLWKGFSKTINNPTIANYDAGTYTDAATGNKYNYSIQVNETLVTLKAERLQSSKRTILSYATNINNYVKIRIELNKQEDGSYIAFLYLDDVQVAKSIKLDSLPKANIVGKTVIGTEEEYFSGYIKNVRIYEMGD